jgi:hypothetical protein
MAKGLGHRVKRFATPVSNAEMLASITRVWKKLFQTTPTAEQLAMIMSHNDLETGHRKSMWNYNVGNITVGNSDHDHNYYDDLTTNEQVAPGKWESAKLKYRAFDTLDEGMEDYLKFISKRPGWKWIMDPNPEAYSKALKASGYYTANESDYTRNMKGLFQANLRNPLGNGKPSTQPTKQLDRPKPKPMDLDQLLSQLQNQINALASEKECLLQKYAEENRELRLQELFNLKVK